MIWLELLVFLGILLAVQGLGRVAMLPLRQKNGQEPEQPALGRLEAFVWTQGLGLAALLALAGILSLGQALKPLPVVLVLLPPALWGVWGLIQGRFEKGASAPGLSFWEKIFLAGIIFHLTVGLVQALAPPTWGDGLHVMFVFAREYASTGSVQYLPSVYASRPQNMTLLFTLAQVFGRPEGSQLISWWLGVLSVLALTALTGRAAGRRVGLAAGLMLAAVPLMGQLTGRGMSGTGLVFFSILGLMAVREVFFEKRSPGWAAAAGLCLGLAAGFKVAGLTVVVIGSAAALFEALRHRRDFSRAAVIIVVALAAAAPWYIYAWAHTGQVFYRSGPIQGMMSQSDLDRWQVERETEPAAGQEAQQKGTKKAFELADDVSPSLGFIFHRLAKKGRDPFKNLWKINTLSGHRGRNVGPFILLFLPVLFLLGPVRRSVVWLAWVGLIHAGATTFLLGPYARYALPGLAVALAGSAWAWWSMVKRGGWTRVLAVIILLAGWGALLPERGYTLARDLPVAFGLEDRAAYTARFFPQSLKAYKWIDDNLPEGARLVVIAESRPWFLERRYFDAAPEHSPLFNYETYRSWLDLDRDVKKLKVGFVVINWQQSDNAWELGRGGADKDQALVRAWANERLEPIHKSGQITIYKIKQEGPSD